MERRQKDGERGSRTRGACTSAVERVLEWGGGPSGNLALHSQVVCPPSITGNLWNQADCHQLVFPDSKVNQKGGDIVSFQQGNPKVMLICLCMEGNCP